MLDTYLGQVLLVGLGGFVGSSARFVVGGLVHRLAPFGTFPYGTLTVNVLGCLAIGFLGGMADLKQVLGAGQRAFLLIGVLGGVTTFSTFAYESFGLAQDSDMAKAAANVVLHVAAGFGAAWLGYLGARFL
ncbi:MAG: fluoride efflux transporter CrcB [Acidobacteriota bacterium]|nr:fluoride efflux transporter CrcB [Acidobacteriota bacterium]